MKIHNSTITLEKNNQTYTWQEWIELHKNDRYSLLQIYGPGHWRAV